MDIHKVEAELPASAMLRDWIGPGDPPPVQQDGVHRPGGMVRHSDGDGGRRLRDEEPVALARVRAQGAGPQEEGPQQAQGQGREGRKEEEPQVKKYAAYPVVHHGNGDRVGQTIVFWAC